MTDVRFYETTTMRVPESMPESFCGCKAFVRICGVAVWSELCDLMPIGEWFTIDDVAQKLNVTKNYTKPGKYLRAVIRAIILDQQERADEYEKPVIEGNSGVRLTRARLLPC